MKLKVYTADGSKSEEKELTTVLAIKEKKKVTLMRVAITIALD